MTASFVRKYLILIIIVVLAGIVAFGYYAGFRIGPGVTLSRVGMLSLSNLPKGAMVYTDQARRTVTAKAGGQELDMTPGSHMVIVSASSSYPWSALVSINSGKTTTLDPLLIQTPVVAAPITGDDAQTALAAIASTTLPASSTPITLAGGCALVTVQDNQIVAWPANAASCTPPSFLSTDPAKPTVVFAPVAPLEAVLPYPGRQDALVVEVNSSVYAIALDPAAPQFFAPIIEGAMPPAMGMLSDGTIVGREGNSVFSLPL